MGNIYHAAYNGFADGEQLTISRHFIKTALEKMPLQKAVPSCPLFLKHIPFQSPDSVPFLEKTSRKRTGAIRLMA